MFLEAGGAKPPSKPLSQLVEDAVREPLSLDKVPRNMVAWLESRADLAHLATFLGGEDIAALCGRLA